MKKSVRIGSFLLALAMLIMMIPTSLAAGEYSSSITPPVLTPKLYETRTVSAAFTADGEPVTQDMLEENGWSVKWSVLDDRGDEVSVEPVADKPFEGLITALALPQTTEQIKAVKVQAALVAEDSKILASATCEVTVTSNVDPSIELSATAVELDPEGTKQLSATVLPEGESYTITWSSEDPSIAEVDKNTGLITAKKAGRTKITAKVDGKPLEASCDVTVRGIVLAVHEIELRTRDNYHLEYEVYGTQLQGKSLTWSVNTEGQGIVRVESGYVYPLLPGEAEITVSVDGYSDFTDTCKVTVKSSTAEVIEATATTGSPLAFTTLLSDLKRESLDVLGSSLSYVSTLSVPTSQGTLYYNYVSEGNTGDGVASSANYYVYPGNGQNSLSNITFVPKADFEGTAVISYTGYASGTEFFQGTIEVTIDAPDDVTYASSNGNVVQFDASDFALVCRQQTGGDLNYVTFSLPDESRGTLYEGYLSESYPGNPVAVNTKYKYSGTPNLGDVYFLPKPGTSGTVTITYTGYNVNGSSFRGRVTIQVKAASPSGDITYSIGQGGRVNFDDSDFNDLSRSLTGYNLDRVRFELPPSSQGVLYYNYTSSGNYSSLVTENRDYYRSSSLYLDNVTFVANEDYAGTVTIPFTGWDTQGNRFSGQIGISVSSQGSGAIRYSVYKGGAVTFDDSDFNDLSQDLTGANLNYVRFTLPASSRGTLYYNYTSSNNYGSKVSESRNYYRSSSPRLDDVTFVAGSSFTGTVTIDFTGWNTKGENFNGTVEIDVGSTQNPLNYQVMGGSVLTFQDGDFDDYCRAATGDSLDYVRFTLPTTSQGTLYYDYTSSNNYGSKVSATRNYYRSSSPYLDRVSFVPASGYSGTFSLNFTGWSTKGRQFSGTVTITVTQKQAGNITYTTAYNPVTFQAADFVAACNQRGEGTLVSVQFTNVDWLDGGQLCYRYSGIHSTNIQVRPTTAYTPSSTPSISEVSFVPWVGYQGTVSISYTATDSKGATYQGTVRIQVTPNTTSRYFNDMGSASWAVAAVDFLSENGVVGGTGAGAYSPNAAITRGSFLVMLDQAFQMPGGGSHSFSDVPADAYYAQAVQKAYSLGVAAGYPDGTFRPNDPITREAAATMLYQAMIATGWSIGREDESVLYRYSDWQSISSYARGAMSVLVQNGLMSGDDQNCLRPGKTMSRAEMAVVLARALTL